MTKSQIEKVQVKANAKYEVAKAIRELLDAAKKTYGATEWADDDMETEIQTLVFEE